MRLLRSLDCCRLHGCHERGLLAATGAASPAVATGAAPLAVATDAFLLVLSGGLCDFALTIYVFLHAQHRKRNNCIYGGQPQAASLLVSRTHALMLNPNPHVERINLVGCIGKQHKCEFLF